MARDKAKIAKRMKAYNARPEQIKNRSKRVMARRLLEKEGKVAKGDGKDVHHKFPLIKGGTNARSNLAVASAAKNRASKKRGKVGPQKQPKTR